MADGARSEGPPSDVGRMAVAFAPRLMHAIRHRLGRLDAPLTYRQYRMLLRVGEGLARSSRCARRRQSALSTLSEIVDSLARRGLIARMPSEDDRRGVELSLTSQGQQALSQAVRCLDELSARLLAPVPETSRRGLRRALEIMDAEVAALLGEEHAR